LSEQSIRRFRPLRHSLGAASPIFLPVTAGFRAFWREWLDAKSGF
jgi:hypothetical protein